MQLKKFIEQNRMDERKAMNLLQNYGIISDNCIGIEDVYNEADAIRFLSGYIPCSLCGKPRRECCC